MNLDFSQKRQWPVQSGCSFIPVKLSPGRSWRLPITEIANIIGGWFSNSEAQGIKVRLTKREEDKVEILILGEGCPAVGLCPIKAELFPSIVQSAPLESFDLWLHERGWFWFDDSQVSPDVVENLVDCVSNSLHER